MKILLSTYSAESHTSYGIVTRHLWSRLAALHPDWQILQHGWFHDSIEPVGWKIIPTNDDRREVVGAHKGDCYGRLSFEDVVQSFKPDVVWTLSDPYMCDYMGQYRSRYGFKLIKHCPVDGVPQPDSWARTLKDCDTFVPITNLGATALAAYFDNKIMPHIYHGVDTARFRPMTPEIKEKMRPKKIGDDATILGFVGQNQFRKMNWAMFPVLKYLRTGAYGICPRCGLATLAAWDYPSRTMGPTPTNCEICRTDSNDKVALVHPGPRNVHLWMHCFHRPNVPWLPERMVQLWNLGGAVIFSSDMKEMRGTPDKDMPYLYNVFDIYMGLSGAEGFCIPMAEAMACGVPVVYTDYSGHGEVGSGAGIPVKPLIIMPDQLEPVGRAIPNVKLAIAEVVKLIDNKEHYLRTASKCLIKAREEFSWDSIAIQWDKLISDNFKAKRCQTVGVSI
jgi:glycosyltransferase involved in cell wall biosynthesis